MNTNYDLKQYIKNNCLIINSIHINRKDKYFMIYINLYSIVHNLKIYFKHSPFIFENNMDKDIEYLGMLTNIYSLDLSNCSFIKNVNILENVRILNLFCCYLIGNVSINNLKNVHNLNLDNCYKITNISMLHNVKTLSLYACKNIKDVGMLKLLINFNLSTIVHGVYLLKNLYLFEVSKYLKNSTIVYVAQIKKLNKYKKLNCVKPLMCCTVMVNITYS